MKKRNYINMNWKARGRKPFVWLQNEIERREKKDPLVIHTNELNIELFSLSFVLGNEAQRNSLFLPSGGEV